MNPRDRLITRFRLKLSTVLALKYTLTALTILAFAWGTAVLVLRATAGTPREWLLGGVAALPLALVPALVLARRKTPSSSAVRALLDRHNALGGLLMASEEVPLGDWQDELATPTLPAIRWRAGQGSVVFAAGLAFLLAGFLLPERFVAHATASRLDVQREVAKLSEQVTVLKEEKLLEVERAGDIQKKLDQLREESSARDPARAHEALDRVSDVVKQKAKEAVEALLRKSEDLGQAEGLAEGLRRKVKKQGGMGLSEKARKQAMQELAALTRKALEENAKRNEGLDRELLDALEKGLRPEDLKKLADALRDARGDLARVMAKLEKVRLVDAETLKQCEKCGQCDGEALAAFLAKNEGKGFSMRELIALFQKEGGRGGQDRGTGPAKLTFGKPAADEEKKFKEEALPPGALADLKQSKLRGVSPSVPKVEDGKPAGAGALAGATAGGGSANTPVVLPRHRPAVERYFDRPNRSSR